MTSVTSLWRGVLAAMGVVAGACILGVPGCKESPKSRDKSGTGASVAMGGPMARAAAPHAGEAPVISEADARAKVKAILAELAAERYAEVAARFAPSVKAALPAGKLKQMWEGIQVQVGAYQSFRLRKSSVKQGTRAVFARLTFARSSLDMVMAFDKKGQMSGIHFKPVKGKDVAWKPPPYAQASQVREISVTVGEGPLALPGLLTVPAARGGKRYPAVVLVHGSGPQDRDETIGPNKIFKDIAWGLAAQGIVVLRYDKVTKAHPLWAKKMLDKGKITVDTETTNDALAAVALLRKNALVQPGRVFYLGHSQGAMMAPRAGKRDPKLAGLILLAGPTRSLADLGLAQLEYIAGAGGSQAAAAKKLIPAYKKGLALVKDPKLSPKTPAAQLPLGIPASFWLDLRGYDPGKVAAGLQMPMLVLQGEADYQVTFKDDFAAWKRALRGKRNATLRHYPHLGHTFIDLKKQMAMPMDYMKIVGHVEKQVIDDISAFIRGAK